MKSTCSLAALLLSAGCLFTESTKTAGPNKSTERTTVATPPSPIGGGSAFVPSSGSPSLPGNETTPEAALSVVSFGEFQGPMSTPLFFVFREGFPEYPPDAPVSFLEYSPGLRDGKGLMVGLAYSGAPGPVPFGKLGGGVSIWEPGASGSQWHSVEGLAIIQPASADGNVRVEFSGVVLEDLTKFSKGKKVLGPGFVEGKLVVNCYKLETRPSLYAPTPNPPPPARVHVLDKDWTSPFCASVKSK